MKIGLYFGSFNPIHTGHLIIASFVADNSTVDKVWFVVSPQNPFKKSATLLNEYDRLNLVRLATDDDLRLKCSDVEFKLPKPSYTIDTLNYLKEKYPDHTYYIIIGSDSLQNISGWKNSKTLLENYSFIVYERPGYKVDRLSTNFSLLKGPLLDISSTNIRNYIKEGKSIKYMVPETVFQEIEKNSYYKNKTQ